MLLFFLFFFFSGENGNFTGGIHTHLGGFMVKSAKNLRNSRDIVCASLGENFILGLKPTSHSLLLYIYVQ